MCLLTIHERQPCYAGGLCYLESAVITEYLNRPEIRATLGVDAAAGNYSTNSNAVGGAFWSHLDKYAVPTQEYVAQLLDRGVRVLIYAGVFYFAVDTTRLLTRFNDRDV